MTESEGKKGKFHIMPALILGFSCVFMLVSCILIYMEIKELMPPGM